MEPDEIADTIRQANGFASLGIHLEAWELIETLPAEGAVRLQPAVIAVRLMVCTGLQKWKMGQELAPLITAEHALEYREACGRFLLALSDHFCGRKLRDEALASIRILSKVWPEGRDAALGSRVMRADWL